MRTSKPTRLLLYFFWFFSCGLCVTQRTASIRVHNNTPWTFSGVSLSHKYSHIYKNARTWSKLPPGGCSDIFEVQYNTGASTTGKNWWLLIWHDDREKVSRNSITLRYSNPDNFRSFFDALEPAAPTLIAAALKAAKIPQPEFAGVTKVANVVLKALCNATLNTASTDGYKQHILRSDDEKTSHRNVETIIRINKDGTMNFKSPSGTSNTVYITKTVQLGL